jgi:hypothetical protein
MLDVIINYFCSGFFIPANNMLLCLSFNYKYVRMTVIIFC